ncbi:hypothetical protein [Simplicispira psychrophila]|uniref:hypothetical protein n=1 Tax=Simplicispira psychrophila TaxID=80882 RepID=UPI00146FB371|nr:hypothetical protein [Simplicispira psychrophila]
MTAPVKQTAAAGGFVVQFVLPQDVTVANGTRTYLTGRLLNQRWPRIALIQVNIFSHSCVVFPK